MGALLLPGHEKQPAHPLPPGPRPGAAYRVHTHETWETVAVKHKVTVAELIANNCGLNVTPEEINWYLHTRVGCNVTHDKKNWAFSDSASPGLVYIPAPGAVPTASQNPLIKTLYGGPKDLGCGGMEWLVEFELPHKAGSDGWIIQQVSRSYDIRLRNDSVADPQLNAPKTMFWEAWPVKKGAIKTSTRYDATADGRTYDDAFDQPKRPNLKGTFKVVALAKFFEVTLPSTFKKQNPQTRAFDLPSTIVKPDFWDGAGTVHNLTVTWDCTKAMQGAKTKITTDVRAKK
jgi:hypothetical protein